MFKQNKTYKCYVSGEETHLLYSFGSLVTLPLTQEVFAKFILRAGKDEKHKKVMAEIKTISASLEKMALNADKTLADYILGIPRPNEDIGQVQLELYKQDVLNMVKFLDKAEAGIRILNDIKKEEYLSPTH